MPIYAVQHRIKTLLQISYSIIGKQQSLILDGYKITNRLKEKEGFGEDLLIEKEIDAINVLDAINKFRNELDLIVSKISFSTQCAMFFWDESFLITKKGTKKFIFKVMQDASGVGLHIDDQYYDNIVKIINNTDISQEFLFFMLQYNNATSYFSKLAFLLSALEAFVGEIEKEKSEGLYIQSLGLIYDKIESGEVKNNIEELLQTMRTKMKYPYKGYDVNNMKKVLGHDLYNKIYGLSGIRHKLFHGKKIDQSENFVEMIYGKIRDYCNQKYDGLINSNVQHPGRNPFGNKKGGVFHLEVNSDAGIELKFLLEISNELPKLEGIEFKKNDFTYVGHKIDVNKF